MNRCTSRYRSRRTRHGRRARSREEANSKADSKAGFTLIEMLVAIAILALVAVLAWRGLDAAVRSRDGVTRNLNETRALSRLFSQLQYDASNLEVPDAINGAPLLLASNEVVLVRRVSGAGEATQVQVVRYQLDGRRLLRGASRPLSSQAELTNALQNRASLATVVVSDAVHDFNVSVWLAPGGWTTQANLVRDAYTRYLAQAAISSVGTQNMSLPRGIVLSFAVGTPPVTYRRVAPLGE